MENEAIQGVLNALIEQCIKKNETPTPHTGSVETAKLASHELVMRVFKTYFWAI